MKNYTINNYKGDVVESVKNFQKKYPNLRVVKVCEEDGKLKICANESSDDDCCKDAASIISFVQKNSDKYDAKFLQRVKEIDSNLLDSVCKAAENKEIFDFISMAGYSPQKKKVSVLDMLKTLLTYTASDRERKELVDALLKGFLKKGFTTIDGTAHGEHHRFVLK